MRIGEVNGENNPAYVLFLTVASIVGLFLIEAWLMWDFTVELANLVHGPCPANTVGVIAYGVNIIWWGLVLGYIINATKWTRKDAVTK